VSKDLTHSKHTVFLVYGDARNLGLTAKFFMWMCEGEEGRSNM
jgi:hypothetical protein